jgi:hypothetical protein
MFDMNQCNLGDELILRDGDRVTYLGKSRISYRGLKYAHDVKDRFGITFEVSHLGSYELEGEHEYDVIRFAVD